MTIKEEVIKQITNKISEALKEIGINDESPISEIPPSAKMGNLAFPMFKYAPVLKKNPVQIAQEVQKKIKNDIFIEKIEINGAYINIFYNIKHITNKLLTSILKKNEKFGKQEKKNKKVIVEFSCPNTNKPLHLGHCRNNVLGDSISRILKFSGFDVVKVNLINDRGIHICKSMIAYKRFGNNTTPEKEDKKSDHLVGDFYVKYAKESEKDNSLEKEAQKLLKLWEEGDKETIGLWRKMNKWAIDGINETYKRMQIEFDEYEYESINYLSGKEIVNLGMEKKVFYKNDDNSIWIDNEDVGLDKKIIIRSDGTSVYITQDIGTAVKRFEKYNFDKMIYVVASEQEYHFKTLFTTLKKLGYPWADNCKHLSYGMVNLPEGKMKSREGNVVDADNLMDLLDNLAFNVIVEKEKEVDDNEKKEISKKISLAALKYYLLNFSPLKDIMFVPEKSISFDGNTGPYLQYTTARLNSLFLKSEDISIIIEDDIIKDYKLNDDEANLVLQIFEYEDALIRAQDYFSPLEICTVLYNIARQYNKFYHDNPVLKAKGKDLINLRLILSKAVHILLKNGLYLLGIEALEKM